jgi:cytochrome P450
MRHLIRPPGPASRGVVGNFPMGSKDPLGVYAEWGRRYGDLFYYRALHRHVYFVNNPELIKQVLVTDYRNFVKGEVVRFNRRIFGDGLISNEGESWLHQRRLIQPAFHRERIESYGKTMVADAEEMASSWKDGETRDIYAEMMRLGLAIVTKALFNVEFGGERDRFAAALDTVLELNSGVRMLLPPALRLLPTPGNLRFLRAAGELDRIVYGLIRRRRASGEAGDDLLYALIEARDESGRAMPDKQLHDEVMTLVLAGHETTAVSLSWTWYLLARHPEIESKLWAELSRVLQGRNPTVADLPQLTYTQCVIKEGMRLYPAVWALVRTPVKDCEIGGYEVPAGSTVLMSQWVMQRDPRYFDEPERFDPDRWQEERAKEVPKFAYFPFGAGARACIGAAFAGMEAALVLATIAQRYKLRVAPDARVEMVPTITLRPRHGIRMVLSRRTEGEDRVQAAEGK